MVEVDSDGLVDRVKRLRLAHDLKTQQAMSDFIGVEFNRWNNVERGLPLSHDLAVRLCQKFPGVTLDWLYFGKADGLPLELARRIGEAPKGTTAPSKGPRSR